MISYAEFERKTQTVWSLMGNILAALGWGFFGLVWPAITTEAMFVSVAYLWYAIGIIFGLFAVYNGMRMLGAIFGVKQKPILSIQNNDDEDD